MSKTIRDVQCKPGLPLRKVLWKWVALNKEIAKEWMHRKDVPWRHRERACISIFSGAVWLSRNQAFEEFRNEKHHISHRYGKFSRRIKKGRVDLYLNIDSNDFIAEAKHCTSGATLDWGHSPEKIEKNLRRACRDVKESKPKGQRRLAMVFAVPVVRTTQRPNVESQIRKWLDKLAKIDCDAIAWVFPAVARKFKHKSRYYPGVVLIVKEI